MIDDFQEEVSKFVDFTRSKFGWTKDDVAFLLEEYLDRDVPMPMSAALIDAERHQRVVWKKCPSCRVDLTKDDKRFRFGFCQECFDKDKSGIDLLRVSICDSKSTAEIQEA